MKMTRNHSAMSLSTSCLRVPDNPYSQQPSPSYGRRRMFTPNTEDDSSLRRKLHPNSTFSRPASSMNSPIPKRGIMTKSTGKQAETQAVNNSPLDSFLDFYESIPDYQDVTHLSDKEFADKMKLLRDKQRQYLHGLGASYSPKDYEECQGESQNYQKTCKSVNKLQLAKEWLNKSCDSLSSIGRKSESDVRIRSLDVENHLKNSQSVNVSPRKYVQYDIKGEAEGLMMDSGSFLSTDSNTLKTKSLRSTFAAEEDPKSSTSHSEGQDCHPPFTSTGRSESCRGISTLYALKDSPTCNYDSYNLKESTLESHPPLSKKKNPSSCGLRSSGTSDLNVLDSNSHLGLSHQGSLNYEDYYVPTCGWMQSDSDSMLGTMHHIPSTRPSTAMMSQSLPGSPITKRTSSSSKTQSSKKKTCRRRAPQKSITIPVPFSFMRNDRQYSRSTPDLSSHCRSPSPKPFRARPVPHNLFSNYVYQKKQQDEFFRALKRKIRSQEMLRSASLPPCMEFRERLNRVQVGAAAAAAAASLAAVSSSSEQSGAGGGADGGAGDGDGASGGREGRSAKGSKARRPRGRARGRGRTRRPPDFSKCHEKMRQELCERQGRTVTTSPSPYSLRTASLSPRRKCLQGSTSSGSGMDTASVTSRTNLAALLRIQSARQRLEAEQRRLREEQVRSAQARIRDRLTRLTPAWRAIQYSTEEDLALRGAVRREEQRQRRQRHGQQMRRMEHRVRAIPTLFERQATAVLGSRCGPGCPALTPDDDDEEEEENEVFAPNMDVPPQRGPCRSRQRERPCSAGAVGVAGAGAGRRGAVSASPDKRHRRRPAASAADALHSLDLLSRKLQTCHRQLPLPHRVEFSDSPVVSVRGQDNEDCDEDRDDARGEDEAGDGAVAEGGSGASCRLHLNPMGETYF